VELTTKPTTEEKAAGGKRERDTPVLLEGEERPELKSEVTIHLRKEHDPRSTLPLPTRE
jgi:hypothetical protein